MMIPAVMVSGSALSLSSCSCSWERPLPQPSFGARLSPITHRTVRFSGTRSRKKAACLQFTYRCNSLNVMIGGSARRLNLPALSGGSLMAQAGSAVSPRAVSFVRFLLPARGSYFEEWIVFLEF